MRNRTRRVEFWETLQAEVPLFRLFSSHSSCAYEILLPHLTSYALQLPMCTLTFKKPSCRLILGIMSERPTKFWAKYDRRIENLFLQMKLQEAHARSLFDEWCHEAAVDRMSKKKYELARYHFDRLELKTLATIRKY
uniref:Uncharacterized protein n=1 Tax=Parascaris univalens TaxID=6257 RepID=A0A915A329_PARUN